MRIIRLSAGSSRLMIPYAQAAQRHARQEAAPAAARVRIRAAGRMALTYEGCEIPVEMIGLCWLRDSRLRMTRIVGNVPTGHFMTTTSPDLPRPNWRGFSAMLRCCTQSP
jgi:hypothetical protein